MSTGQVKTRTGEVVAADIDTCPDRSDSIHDCIPAFYRTLCDIRSILPIGRH